MNFIQKAIKRRKLKEEKFNLTLTDSEKLEYYTRFDKNFRIVYNWSIYAILFLTQLLLLLTLAFLYSNNPNYKELTGMTMLTVFNISSVIVYIILAEILINFISLLWNNYQKKKWLKEKGL